MLFRKKIEPACAYCANSSPVDEDTLICVKKGLTSPWQKCSRFSYDPLKRVPEPPVQPSAEGIDSDSFNIT